ncbi:MAG TPA: DinB family protein [Candidatus Sulfomarinibacteraceae bacterium]|nr:DinB family protein [Candidatus Sulfomarinibacteraceae bacterium]
MTHPLVEQLRFTRSEWRRALRGVPEADGFRRFEPINSIGWIVAHLAWHEQRYWLTRLGDSTPEPILDEIAAYGRPASTPSLRAMRQAWTHVTSESDRRLDELDEADMTATLPGAPKRLIGNAILRVTYHYWFHIGEILAIRQLLDHPNRPEFVGDLEARASYRGSGER